MFGQIHRLPRPPSLHSSNAWADINWLSTPLLLPSPVILRKWSSICDVSFRYPSVCVWFFSIFFENDQRNVQDVHHPRRAFLRSRCDPSDRAREVTCSVFSFLHARRHQRGETGDNSYLSCPRIFIIHRLSSRILTCNLGRPIWQKWSSVKLNLDLSLESMETWLSATGQQLCEINQWRILPTLC